MLLFMYVCRNGNEYKYGQSCDAGQRFMRHETIFVLASDRYSVTELNRTVADINELQVAVEERLTDHCYFYDAGKDEIRMEP